MAPLASSIDVVLPTTPLGLLVALIAALCAVCVAACCLLRRRSQLFPGGPDGSSRALFRQYREDAFLLQLERYGQGGRGKSGGEEGKSSSSSPPLTITMDTLTATAHPATVRALLMSRAHSVGRSWVYRLVAWMMPLSDGILFAADDEWKRRHSAFTPFFTGGHVAHYTAEMFAAAVKTAEAQLSSRPSSSSSSSSSPSPTPEEHRALCGASASLVRAALAPGNTPALGADRATGADLLTFVRWAAMRMLLVWGLGLNTDDEDEEGEGEGEGGGDNNGGRTVFPGSSPDHPAPVASPWEARRLARILDAYSRTCFEVLPAAERGRRPLLAWLSAYAALHGIAGHIRAVLDPISRRTRSQTTAAAAAAAARSTGGSLPSPPQPPPTTTPTPTPTPAFLETPFRRLVALGWSDADLASEVNHVHGAHKAIALLTTAALTELTAHPAARERCRAEMLACCGAPPANMSAADIVRSARQWAAAGGIAATASGSGGVGGGVWRPPTRADVEAGRLPFASRVMKETARRHVVSMGTMRRLGEPMVIPAGGGAAAATAGDSDASASAAASRHLLPGGHEVMVLLHALHHSRESWGDDAHVWEPDRWDAGSRYWQDRCAREGSASPPPPHCFPASCPDAYYPFLAGTRQCGGMVLAHLEFFAMLYAFLVVYDVNVVLPEVPAGAAAARAQETGGAAAEGVGGGVAVGCGRLLVPAPPGTAIAAIADPLEHRSPVDGVRFHLIKRPDMFTSIDGVVPFTVRRR
jgi:cytochrome P450